MQDHISFRLMNLRLTGSFKSCNVRARRAIESGRFPADILKQIDESTSSVFPVLKLFQAGSPLQQELKELICAWYVSRTDEGLGYVSKTIL